MSQENAPHPQSESQWSDFIDDAVRLIGADDKLMAATADLLQNPYDQGTRKQMIGLLTSEEYQAASKAAQRISTSSEDQD